MGRNVLTGRAAPYGRVLYGDGPFAEKDDEEAYGKPLTGKDGPYGKGRSLPGSRIGREFPLVCRRPKKAVSY